MCLIGGDRLGELSASMNLQLFLYRSAELSDELLNVRTPDYCSARDNLVSTSLRGEGRRGGRGERRKVGRRREEERHEAGKNAGKKGEEQRRGKERRGKRGRERVTEKGNDSLYDVHTQDHICRYCT